jgi:protein SCO1/2
VPSRWRRLAAALAASLALAARPLAAAEVAPGPGAAEPPPALRQVGIDQRLDAEVPRDLVFRDEGGKEVELGRYFGAKPVVLVLAYYECPMLCTLVLNGLTRALKVLSFDVGREFEVVTVSFDPRESPALAAAKKAAHLADYGRAGAAAGWHFLTGEGPAIERLAQSVGYRYTWVPEERQFAHAAAIMVLTPEGRVARYLYGVEYAPRDLRLALVEAADHRIGSPVDQLLLYCYRWDPAAGRYGAAALRLVRLGGVVTVLALATLVLAMRRREGRA